MRSVAIPPCPDDELFEIIPLPFAQFLLIGGAGPGRLLACVDELFLIRRGRDGRMRADMRPPAVTVSQLIANSIQATYYLEFQ